jgi:RNA polymerase sigma factor (sigma-70 family)
MPKGVYKRKPNTTDYSKLKRWTDKDDVSDAELCAQFDGWIHLCINKYANAVTRLADEHRDDIAQECKMRLMKMPQQPRPYTTYVCLSIKRQVIRSMDRLRKHGFKCSPDNPLPESYDGMLEDFVKGKGPPPPAEDPTRAALAKTVIDQALSRMDPKLALVLRLYHIDGLYLDQIGEGLGVTRERVRQILAKGEHQLLCELTGKFTPWTYRTKSKRKIHGRA